MAGPPARRRAAARASTIERRQQQHDRDGRRGRQVFVLDLPEDVHRADLGLERQVARDQHERAELADRAREAERDARDDRRAPALGSTIRRSTVTGRRPARRRLPPSSGRARSAPAAPSGRRTAASRTAAPAPTDARVNATSMPIGLPLPYSASSTTPATIVGSANGRSISALTMRLAAGTRRARAPMRSASRRPR